MKTDPHPHTDELLLALIDAVGRAPDYSSALATALKLVCEHTEWVYGEAWLPAPDGSVLGMSPAFYVHPAGAEDLQHFRTASQAFAFAAGQGLPGRDVDLTIDPLPPCTADPTLLRQVFANLLENALKVTRSRPVARIHVGAKQENDTWVYFIMDNGLGFDPKYANKLFGVFQRLHRAETYEGTGIGLANVQRILHRHDGRIWADATVGEGATFYFTIGSQKTDTENKVTANGNHN